MRSADIKFSQRSAEPGGIISGVVLVETDKTFECNRVILKVKGKERTEIGSGDSKIADEHYHIKGKIELSEGLPPTYSGYNGWIEYSVEAVVEMDWTIDPKITRRFRVIPFQPAYIPEPDGYDPINKDKDILHVELLSNILRMKEGISVRFMGEEHSRVNGVRLELRRRETVRCQRRESTHDVTIKEKFIPITFREFDRWREETIGEGWRHIPFQSKLIETFYFLKVTLEMRWELDPFVRFRLKISGEKLKEDVEDLFADFAFDLGFN
ncbi:MAG: hypothetical protein PVJ05_12350 [Candidatus Thorarchaeota archaeon]|jgi:hypothetical protein